MYSLGHGLRTLPAVPRSTQPSTLRGMVKWVSAFGLSNNNTWRWWDVDGSSHLSADSQPKSVGLVWGLAATQHSVCIHQMNRVNSRTDHGQEDSTINIVVDYYYYLFAIHLPCWLSSILNLTCMQSVYLTILPHGCWVLASVVCQIRDEDFLVYLLDQTEYPPVLKLDCDSVTLTAGFSPWW